MSRVLGQGAARSFASRRVILVLSLGSLACAASGCKSEKTGEAKADNAKNTDDAQHVKIARLNLKAPAGASVKDDGTIATITAAQPDCTAAVFDPTAIVGADPSKITFEAWGSMLKNINAANSDVQMLAETKVADGYVFQFRYTGTTGTKFASHRRRTINGAPYMCRGDATSETGMKCIDALCQSLAPATTGTTAKPVEPSAANAKPPAPSPSLPEWPQACIDLKNTTLNCEAETPEKRQEMVQVLQKAVESGGATKADLEALCAEQNRKVSVACSKAKTGGVADAQAAAKMKETVKFENAEWIVLSASFKGRKLASNNMFEKAITADEGKFVLVQFKIKNLTKEKATTEPPKLKDGQGRVFEPIESAAFFVPKGKKTLNMLEHIPPSIGKEFWEPYQVADDSTDLVLLTHDLDNENVVTPVALDLK